MAHLRENDIRELFELFEVELRLLWHMDRIEKMQLRRRIRNTLWPIVRGGYADPDRILSVVKEKLGDVIRLFRDRQGFLEKLWDFLADRLDGAALSAGERRRRRLRAVGG